MTESEVPENQAKACQGQCTETFMGEGAPQTGSDSCEGPADPSPNPPFFRPFLKDKTHLLS